MRRNNARYIDFVLSSPQTKTDSKKRSIGLFMATLQTDWTGLVLYFVPPVVYLLTSDPWNANDAEFYAHLSSHSRVYFLQGRAQIVFSIVWTAFFGVLMPLSGYYFWQDTVNMVARPGVYNAGLAFYWIGLVLLLGWFRIFFRMRAVAAAFLYTLAADACVIGFLICCAIAEQVVGIVAFSLLTAWLVVATMWTAVAAFSVPTFDPTRKSEAPPLLSQIKEHADSMFVSSAVPVPVWKTQ